MPSFPQALTDDLRVLLALLRGQRRRGPQAARLEAFYGPQAARYDGFRERLLHGRQELIDRLQPPPGGRVVELGAGTGRNLLFFDQGPGGARLAGLGRLTLVDLCPSLLAVARRRTADLANVQVVEADACRWQPEQPVDTVYFAYALTMIPDWQAAVDNALAMLKPGGQLGVVDFYVSAATPPPGLVKHDAFTRAFWPRWFGHDGVHPSPEPLQLLRERLPEHALSERRAPVPYLPGLRMPYYLFIGRRS
jgi:S-adenosylmethionine-diacylgycerolhomoserine-N-methlytransferase